MRAATMLPPSFRPLYNLDASSSAAKAEPDEKREDRSLHEPRRLVIPPQSGRAFRVQRGDRIRITDPKGQQVADLFAFATEGGLDWLSTSQTRDIAERLFPEVGGIFYSARAMPMLTFIENASPGPHDMLFPACDAGLYERAGLPGHPNCR